MTLSRVLLTWHFGAKKPQGQETDQDFPKPSGLRSGWVPRSARALVHLLELVGLTPSRLFLNVYDSSINLTFKSLNAAVA